MWNNLKLIYRLILVSLLLTLSAPINLKCLKPFRSHARFSLLRTCQRSVQPVVGLSNAKSVSECEKFTILSKGLAFNYSPYKWQDLLRSAPESVNGTLFPRKAGRQHIVNQPQRFYTCHALSCPEVGNLTSLTNDSRFDYYSFYTKPIPPLNTSCIPEVGLFQFHNSSANYSAAFNICATESRGALAHVASERRTNGLSAFLRTMFDEKGTTSRAAYVGLNYSLPTRDFYTSEGESLQCFQYRAWSPGYPRENGNHSCTAVQMDNSWRTLNCDEELPFICEVHSSGPSIENPGFCF